MKNKIFAIAGWMLLLVGLLGCDQTNAVKPIPPSQKLANGTKVLVTVSNIVGTVVQRHEVDAELGDTYAVRYVTITGNLDTVTMREWELQPLSDNYQAEKEDVLPIQK